MGEMAEKCAVTVLGGGSFGTVLGHIAAQNGHAVRLWMRDAAVARSINHEHRNPKYLEGCTLDPGLSAYTDLDAALQDTEALFFAVPGVSCREVARQVARCLPQNCPVISTTKGLEAESFLLMSQVLEQELPGARIGVLSGPNLASELSAGQLAATVIASREPQLCSFVQSLLHCSHFRVYDSADVYGVELAGALKNIYAIIGGIAASLDLGYNTIGMLLTRSLAEMSRFAASQGADPLTFMGLAGTGDLLTTCLSPHSRNYRIGYLLGQGHSLEEALQAVDQAAEGVNTLRLVQRKAAEENVYMPLAQGLYRILYGGETIDAVIGDLMRSAERSDVEFPSRR